MTEFKGKRTGFFRPKPVFRVGSVCKRCGSTTHVAHSTCEVKTLSGMLLKKDGGYQQVDPYKKEEAEVCVSTQNLSQEKSNTEHTSASVSTVD